MSSLLWTHWQPKTSNFSNNLFCNIYSVNSFLSSETLFLWKLTPPGILCFNSTKQYEAGHWDEKSYCKSSLLSYNSIPLKKKYMSLINYKFQQMQIYWKWSTLKTRCMLGFWGSLSEEITFCQDRENLSPIQSPWGMEIMSMPLTASLLHRS